MCTLQTYSHYPAWPPPVSLRLCALPEQPCPYLPERMSRSRAFIIDRMPAEVYHAFMDAGFRRSGKLVYQPVCRGCRACVPIRVPVDRFAPSRSQRRCARRNADLVVTMGRPRASEEKYELYLRYLRDWHHRAVEDETPEQFEAFLYESPVDTLEFEYRRPDGALLAVGICDVAPGSFSSVYFYFDPAHAERGLGNFGVLQEIEHARGARIPYYYIGYWIDGCRTMSYKCSFKPNQMLGTDGVWRNSTGAAS